MIRTLVIIGTIAMSPGMAMAEWCEPPVAPMLTTKDLAQEFREEFKTEFDQYFREASQYIACLDSERTRVFAEMQNTAQRYDRFLSDSATWETHQ